MFLRTAAHSFTAFLQLLTNEILGAFQVIRVNDAAPWYHVLCLIGVTAVCELDCKDQRNRIKSAQIRKHMDSVWQWPQSRKRLRTSKCVWSINHAHKHLDRARQANVAGFKWIAHDELAQIAFFKLEKDNRCGPCGQVWCCDFCIPEGGSFSAQNADLHNIWITYPHHHYF